MAKLIVGVNDLATKYPDLIEEWDWKRNSISPHDVTCGSKRKVWWVCKDYGHSFEMDIVHRTKRGQGCPYCSGRRVLEGFNDLATSRPDLVSEWADDNTLKPNQVTRTSHYDAMWLCPDHAHRYNMPVKQRTINSSGCPYCSRKLVLSGFNDLATTHPNLVSEWSDKNQDSPTDYLYGSQHKAWWKCKECGFEWSACIASRAKGHGCPECAKKAVSKSRRTPLSGESLADKRPHLLDEWDKEANEISPYEIKYRSNRMASWICSVCGYRWDATIASRSAGHGCPKCAAVTNGLNKSKPKDGYSLLDIYPDIVPMLDAEKNEFGPSDISYGSQRKLWWKCPECGYSWESRAAVVAKGAGCPKCLSASHSSFPEKAVFYYISKVFCDAESNAHPLIEGLGKMEFDIWIPSILTAIEYDGEYWHDGDDKVSRDSSKDAVCFNNGIRLIRVREPNCQNYQLPLSTTVIHRKSSSYASLDLVICEVLVKLGCDNNVDVDTLRDSAEIHEKLCRIPENETLLYKRPDIALLWDFDMNVNITPDKVRVSDKTVVWWKCKHGHSFQRSIIGECIGEPCLICTRERESKRKMTPKPNMSFGDLYPTKASEWVVPVDDKYAQMTPYDFKPRSNVVVKWKCGICGDTWTTTINTRARPSSGDHLGCRRCRMKTYRQDGVSRLD